MSPNPAHTRAVAGRLAAFAVAIVGLFGIGAIAGGSIGSGASPERRRGSSEELRFRILAADGRVQAAAFTEEVGQ